MEINEPAIAYSSQKYSIESYLQMEEAAEQKHEFYKGEIIAMAGAGPRHNVLFSNLFGELTSQLKGNPCRHTAVT